MLRIGFDTWLNNRNYKPSSYETINKYSKAHPRVTQNKILERQILQGRDLNQRVINVTNKSEK